MLRLIDNIKLINPLFPCLTIYNIIFHHILMLYNRNIYTMQISKKLNPPVKLPPITPGGKRPGGKCQGGKCPGGIQPGGKRLSLVCNEYICIHIIYVQFLQ